MKKLVLIIRKPDLSFNYQSHEFRELSRRVRDEANWECEECGINLSNDHFYLHAHHIWGTQYNSLNDLEALCIGCHSKQPGNGHLRLKEKEAFQGFIRLYGGQWRSLRKLAE